MRQIIIEVAEEISTESTASIMGFSEEVLVEFQARGGRADKLAGEELAKLQEIDRDKVFPAISDLIDAEVAPGRQRLHRKQ